jgi:cardiolipin synthase
MLTLPNLLTFARAAGIPLFLYAVIGIENYPLAIVILVLSGFTDYLDGKVARALGQESKLGEILDPAVDRLYIATVLIAMVYTNAIPLWLVLLIVLRDLLLGVLLLLMKGRGIPTFKVSYLGKAATFNLMYALPLLLLTFSSTNFLAELAFILGWAFAGWGIGLYLITGASYARSGILSLTEGNIDV